MTSSDTGDEFQFPIRTDAFLSTEIVRATSAVTGQTITELPPLEDAVSVDALDELYESMTKRGTAHGRFLSVSYCGVTVDVDGDERLYLQSEQVSE